MDEQGEKNEEKEDEENEANENCLLNSEPLRLYADMMVNDLLIDFMGKIKKNERNVQKKKRRLIQIDIIYVTLYTTTK